MTRDELQAAYFTLLRAREELADLQRYQEYLIAEAQRLRRGVSEAAALRGQAHHRHLRGIQHTDRPLDEAITSRLAAISDEFTRLPERISAAEEFVTECEHEHAQLRAEG